MQLLAAALVGCMAADVVDILVKGRVAPRALAARLDGERAGESPKRLTAVRIHFSLTGDVPDDRVQRAIELSRERYCSVWHSLRPDIDFQTSFEVRR